MTDGSLAAKAEEAAALKQALSQYLDKLEQSKMTAHNPTGNEGQDGSEEDPFSIWFEPTTVAARFTYSDLLDSELKLREVNLDVMADLEMRREALRASLELEFRLRKLNDDVEHSERPETALFLLLQAVPCVLHMENRVGHKMIGTLLMEGISEADAGSLQPGINGNVKRMEAYVESVGDVVNKRVLGSEWDPGQWKCPFDSKTRALGPISMENWRTRRVIDSLELLIDVSVSEPSRREQWKRKMPHYRTFMKQARSKEDWNSPEKLSNFQKEVDEWFQDWVDLTKKDGMTNYIHMLSSGHVTDYVFHWKNLYEHSQQGWEALNALVKTVFFRRTGRGGGRKRSRLKPLARWLQRRMLLICGVTEEKLNAFLQSEKDEEETKDDGDTVEQQTAQEDEDQGDDELFEDLAAALLE